MQYNIIQNDKALIIELRGEIDSLTAGLLRELIDGTIQRGHLKIILDLAGIILINSNGLSSLVAAFLTVKRVGGEIRMCCIQPSIQRVFDLTHMERAVALFPTREAALDSF